MSNNKATEDRNWNSQELIKLSQILGEAYFPGLDNDKFSKNDWTISQFIEMSKNPDSNKSQAEENPQ